MDEKTDMTPEVASAVEVLKKAGYFVIPTHSPKPEHFLLKLVNDLEGMGFHVSKAKEEVDSMGDTTGAVKLRIMKYCRSV